MPRTIDAFPIKHGDVQDGCGYMWVPPFVHRAVSVPGFVALLRPALPESVAPPSWEASLPGPDPRHRGELHQRSFQRFEF